MGSISPDRPLIRKSNSSKLDGTKCRDFQGRANGVSQVDGSSDMAPACWLCGCVEGSERDNGLCLPFCLGESCAPALALMPDPTLSPCMPLVPFKLLPWCWSSEEVSLSKSMCGFLKRNYLGLQKFLPSTHSPLVFAARSYGDLSSWHWNPGLGGPGVGLVLLAPEISLPDFYLPHICVGPAHSVCQPLLPDWMDVVSLIL